MLCKHYFTTKFTVLGDNQFVNISTTTVSKTKFCQLNSETLSKYIKLRSHQFFVRLKVLSYIDHWWFCGRDSFNQNFRSKTQWIGSVRKSFEKTGPPFEVDHFSRSDRSEFWLNGSRPVARRLGSRLAHDKTKGLSRVFRGCFLAPLIWTLIVLIFLWLVETISRGKNLYFK